MLTQEQAAKIMRDHARKWVSWDAGMKVAGGAYWSVRCRCCGEDVTFPHEFIDVRNCSTVLCRCIEAGVTIGLAIGPALRL
jgi:hypothetical protein